MKSFLPLFLVSALLLAACEEQPTPVDLDDPDPAEVVTTVPGEIEPANVLTEADNATSVSLAIGEELVIRLGSNPSTGYAWQIHEIGDNLQVVGESRYEATPTEEPVVGSGGHETWRFEAIAEGESTLALHYQPFDEESEPADTWSVNVTVE